MAEQVVDLTPRLASIVASLDDAVISKDVTGTITWWNRGAEQLFGYSADEVIGKSIDLIVPPERRAEEAELLARVSRGERVPGWETIRRHKDGHQIQISVTLSPVYAGSGDVIGATSLSRDITVRKQMEAGLLESQQRLSALANASAMVAGSTDVEEVLTATIEAAREVFRADGYALWRVREGTWTVWRSWGLSGTFTARAVSARGSRPAVSQLPFDVPLVCPDVRAVPLLGMQRDEYAAEGIESLVVFPLRLRGELGGTFSFYCRQRREFSDVDVQVGSALADLAAAALTTASLYEEQHRAREAAERSEHRARFLSSASEALSKSLDYAQTLTTVANLAVPMMADWCAVHIMDDCGAIQQLAVAHVDPAKVEWARRLQERYPSDPDAPGGLHEAIRTQRPTYMFRIAPELLEQGARDAEHREILRALALTGYICVPLVSYGRAFGAITFVSAESGHVYDESDIRMAQELAHRAALAVENARAYARATEASRVKDDFLATLSHELRTPLNAVLGYVRMLQLHSVPPERTDSALNIIERNALALQRMIEDVLDVSRFVAGGVRLRLEPVSLAGLVEDTCASCLPTAHAKEIRLEHYFCDGVTTVSADPQRLRQVVWNLLSNAIKFTGNGGTVRVSLRVMDPCVELEVRDTGRGIAPDFLPAVFERFRQENATFSREYGGLGLGLALAKQLTELHGGTIRAASDGLGMGATFTVTLPLATPGAQLGRSDRSGSLER